MPNIVNNTTLPSLLDLIFPHSCRGCGRIGNVFCKDCKNYIITHRQNFCPYCKKPSPAGKCLSFSCQNFPPTYVISNRNGLLGELIHNYKYYSIRALAHPLAELLDVSLPPKLPANSVLVPLPTATHHIRTRGLDHTLLIAKHLSKIRHLPLEKVLIRNKNTVQVGSDRSKRLVQASLAYSINPQYKIKPTTTYILIDDVWTTGASILSAAHKLQSAGAKDIIIALLAYSS